MTANPPTKAALLKSVTTALAAAESAGTALRHATDMWQREPDLCEAGYAVNRACRELYEAQRRLVGYDASPPSPATLGVPKHTGP